MSMKFSLLRQPFFFAFLFLFSVWGFCQSESTSAQKYKLNLSSSPKGAKVFINGIEKGTTPFKQEFEKGKYKIRIEKEGYKPREIELDINSDIFKSYRLEKLADTGDVKPDIVKQTDQQKQVDVKETSKDVTPKTGVMPKKDTPPPPGITMELRLVDTRPKPIKMAKVRAPRRAKIQKITGSIKVRVLISADGDVLEVEILEMLQNPPDWLHDAVIIALKKWKFSPAVKGGVKVKVWLPFLLTL